MSAARASLARVLRLQPSDAAVPRPLLPALVAVLVLRAVLAIVVLTPAGPLAVAAALGLDCCRRRHEIAVRHDRLDDGRLPRDRSAALAVGLETRNPRRGCAEGSEQETAMYRLIVASSAMLSVVRGGGTGQAGARHRGAAAIR